MTDRPLPVMIDLAFPVIAGLVVPIEHGHQLLGALKQAAPQLAEVDGLGIHPLRGTPLPRGLLHLRHRERLRLRLPADRIAAAFLIVGRDLRVGTMLLRLGSPQVEAFAPHSNLYARTVVVAKTVPKAGRSDADRGNREATEPELIAHVRARCNAGAEVRVLRWRTIRIHGKGRNGGDLQVRGAEVVIEGMDAEHSLRIQAEGIGGRRAFGCGIFVNAGVRKPLTATPATATSDEVGHA